MTAVDLFTINGRRVVLTRGVCDRAATDETFARHITTALQMFARHQWGEVGAEDAAKNDVAVKDKGWCMGAYPHGPDGKVWVIDDGEGGVVTVLFPDEY